MIKLSLELADTTTKRSFGLMDRKDLGEDSGMMFIFPRKSRQSFWMQNTYIPLDIAFLDDSGRVEQIEEMYPLNTRFTSSDKPTRYAVEVNLGWFAKHGVKVGYQMFSGNDWSTELKKNITSYTFDGNGLPARYAQVELDPNVNIEPNQLEGEFPQDMEEIEDPPMPEAGMPEDPNMAPQQQPDPVVQNAIGTKEKIMKANAANSSMDILYWTISGKTLPPRRLIPVPGEGYTLHNGPSGEYMTAYDSSPTIQGNGWVIEGGTPKSFTINNIINLEIVENKGEIPNEAEQTIEEPQNLWDQKENNIL